MKTIPGLLTGSWRLADLGRSLGVPAHGLTVFSCFCCGGGSTMGYKLAGFRSVGGVEIDPEIAAVYRRNHSPSTAKKPWHFFEMPVQEFKKVIPDPAAYPGLQNLDVLDGSPPCSSFSMAGNREKDWTKSKKFREGQADQVLDDLFFHFIEVADKLRPRMVVAENVKGLVMGNARGYVKEIFAAFRKAGYDCQLFLLNASRMGVPQRRERTFFIGRRIDLGIPKLVLEFNEPEIPVSVAFDGLVDDGSGKALSERAAFLWGLTMPGTNFSRANSGSWFNWIRLNLHRAANTLPATCMLCHPTEPRIISDKEAARIQSFPEDFDFNGVDPRYVCGMSVPPLMMQRVASEVARSLLSMPGRVVRRPKP